MNESTVISPGFRELLDENRELREQLGALRVALAYLSGRYERDGNVPLAEVDALLKLGGADDE